MDERMTGGWLLSVVLAFAPGAGAAQGLADPTQPATRAAEAPTSQTEGEAPGRLQSVLLSPGRRVAVIDGVAVPLGGKVGEATLVRIAETEVVLRKGSETQTLRLHPGTEKKPVRRKPAPKGNR